MSSPAPGHPAQALPPDALMDSLAQLSFVFMAELGRVGARSGLSLTQLRVLAILRDRRLRMSELADYLGLEKSTMSGLIDRAEKRGLVRRAPNDSDRRAVDVFLSPDGIALADRSRGDVVAWFHTLSQSLSASEQRRLHELIRTVLDTSNT